MNDTELLQAWASRRDEPAFAELVRRHLGLVHGSALRQVREPVLAQEVAQAVFLVLADKAGSLGRDVVLSGWLFRTTRFVAARALRAERRRTHHEHQAAAMQRIDLDSPSSTATDRWDEVGPHLDAALAALPATDRHAVLLRFFEKQPLRAVGDRLGLGEEAAKKRVSRAVEKLRTFLAGKGVVLTAAGLLALLTEMPSSAAPAGLAERIADTVGTGSAGPAATELAKGAARDWFTARLLDVAPWFAAALVLLMAGGAWWAAPTSSAASQVAAPSAEGTVIPTSAPKSAASTVLPPPAQVGPSRILLNVRSAEDNRPLIARGMAIFWTWHDPTRRTEFITDTNGLIEVAVTGPKASDVDVWISAPGHVPVTLRWKRHEFVEPLLLHTCRLQRGQTLQGIVQDEAGRPVAEAQVQFGSPGMDLGERENIAFHDRFTSVVTDAAGHFRSDQLPALLGNHTMSYTVSHPDFVRGGGDLSSPASLATNHLVVLRRGLTVRGRVVGPDGAAVGEAKVREDHNFVGPHRETQSASDGSFALGPFAAGAVQLEVSAAGFKTTQQPVGLDAATQEVLVRLVPDDGEKSGWEQGMDRAQTVRIVGTAVDAGSGEPLRSFQVRLDEHRGTAKSFIGQGNGGRFDWPVDMVFFQEFSLEVEADGYETVASDSRPVRNGTQEFAFRLRRGGNVSGSVVGPDGRPVAGAFVGLNGDGYGFFVRQDGLPMSGNGAPQTISDAGGRFSLRRQLGAQTVLVVHELGCTLVPLGEGSLAPIVLRHWGAIEGTLLVGGKPAAGQTVSLGVPLPEDDSIPPGIQAQGNATTDAEGRFRFDRVPAGSFTVSRYFNFNRGGTGPVGIGAPHRVEVPAGGVGEATIGTSGRAVVGRLALATPVAGHDWRDDLQSLVQVRDDLPPVKPIAGSPGSPEFMKAVRASARREGQIAKHFLTLQADGSFRIDDVPPGNYLLKLRVSTPPKDVTASDADSFFRPELGELERTVVVPDSPDPTTAGPLDLGVLTIPVKQP